MRITWKDVFTAISGEPHVIPVVVKQPSKVPANTHIPSRPNPTSPQQIKSGGNTRPNDTKFINPPPVVSEPVTMNSDSFFVIGSGHDVCQDYVTSHNNGIKSYVVLADGCSGSKDSDIGSRILVKTHELYIPQMGVMDFDEFSRKLSSMYTQIIEEASTNAKALELDQMALDTTMMSIISNKSGDFMVTCYGDGVVALGRRDGIIETYSVSYNEGYPNYLSYRLSPERSKSFAEKTNNYKEITLEMIGDEEEPLKQKYRSSTGFDIYLGNKKTYSWVAILSDGVSSFMQKVVDDCSITQEPVPTHEVIRAMFDFKGFKGPFVKRRVKRFLESCKQRDWIHLDDLSVGVVYLGDND